MRVALVADPHANRFALQRVQAEIERHAPDQVVCLGDIVGYNAHPSEVVDQIREGADVVVRGNHDVDAIRATQNDGTTAAARVAQDWTKRVLDGDRLAWLGALPNIWVEPDAYVAVHGCYLNDLHYAGYVTSTMLGHNLERIRVRPGGPTIAFCGHTHQPMCGYVARGNVHEPRPTGTVQWPEDADAVLINPGAVGQPRDGDPRAALAIVDLTRRRVDFIRVEYDVAAAQAAIRDAGLPPELADRLEDGR